MSQQVKSFLRKSLWVVLTIFVVRCYFGVTVNTPFYYLGAAGQAVTVAIIIMGIYERYLWRIAPFEKIPRLQKSYNGIINYNFNGNQGEKLIKVLINQTLLTTSVKIVTDEITSNSISSRFIYENGEYILYYVYITNPKSKFSRENPIQYGTTRLALTDNLNLVGIYWTTSKTIGDIQLTCSE